MQPQWVNIPEGLFRCLIDKAKDKKGKELEILLKNEIVNRFKSLNKNPKWLQSPQWVIEDEYPLIFVGQFDITKLRHDITHAYLFLNAKTGRYSTVEQSM
ncbi:hypothetical protein AwWohl_06070 [Gammaproteobacteria bacterium]|nr:hypothetical protein AwWohl_06070 [Gammaproteobacteria bacterium]